MPHREDEIAARLNAVVASSTGDVSDLPVMYTTHGDVEWLLRVARTARRLKTDVARAVDGDYVHHHNCYVGLLRQSLAPLCHALEETAPTSPASR